MTDSLSIAAYTDGDIDTNNSANRMLSSVVSERYSRRQTLMGGLSATALALFGTSMLAGFGEVGEAPVVGPGQNGTANSGRTVTLAGTSSDDKLLSSVSWTQLAGPAVTLLGADTRTATFLAPSVASATELRFRFTTADKAGKATWAETTVTVNPAALGFKAVGKNLNDIVTIPEGYSLSVLYRMGDPIAAGVTAYANDGSDTNFAHRAGDQGDALCYYGLNPAGTARDDNNSARGLLVMNHENICEQYLHAAGPTAPDGVRPEVEAIKEIEAHGVSIVEVSRSSAGAWVYKQESAYNRRITPNTPMPIAATGLPWATSTLTVARFMSPDSIPMAPANGCR